MALTKNTAPTSDVIDILAPNESQERPMVFSAEAIKHVMGRLINMYSDPILSTVREVISNATDATMMLPEDQRRPIEVSSPSTFKPYFVTQDWGVGMSFKDVDEVFRQFESTKKNVLNAIGSHGLGAKAPLAYCSEFTISTTKDGVTTDFKVRNGAAGYSIFVIDSRETGNESGTTVSIPVRMEDRNRFQEVLYSYKNFSFVTPMVIDGVLTVSNPDYTELDPIVIDDDTKTEGRVWVRKDSLHRILKSAYQYTPHSNYSSIELAYNMSGWIYPSNNSSYNFSYAGYGKKLWEKPDVIIEIVPALVDFSSSRDSITDNDRSLSLNNTVRPKIFRMSEYLVKNFIKAFKASTPIESLNLLSSVREMIEISDDHVNFKSESTKHTPILVDRSEFVTNDGFDPIGLSSTTHDSNVIEAIHMSSYSLYEPSDSKSFFPALTQFGAQNSWNSRSGASIGARNTQLKTRIAENNPDISLVDFVTSRIFISETVANMGITVVTGVDDVNILKLCRSRQILSEKVLPNRWALYTTLDTIAQDQIDTVNLLLDNPVEFVTAQDLIAKADVIRKANAALNKTEKPDNTVWLHQILNAEDSKSLSTSSEVVKVARIQSKGVSVTIDDLIAENALIVMGTSVVSTLMGAANEGVKITGRPIYTGDKWAMKAPHYAALKDYSGIIAGPHWKYNSAAARHISDTRTYSANVLDEELKSIEPVDAVSSYLRAQYIRFTDRITFALKSVVDDAEQKAVLELMNDGQNKSKDISIKNETMIRNYSSLVTSIGEEKAVLIKAFFDTVSTLGASYSLEDKLAHALATTSQKIDSNEITIPLLKRIADSYAEHVKIARIDAAAAKASSAEMLAA